MDSLTLGTSHERFIVRGATEGTALFLVLIHRHGLARRGGMDPGCVMVHFVHRDRGVDYLGLDDFLLDDGLDGFVDMVVDMLPLHNRRPRRAVLRLLHRLRIPQLARLGAHRPLRAGYIAVVELALDRVGYAVLVLLGERLGGLHRLDRPVVVVLVDFLVDGGGDLFVRGGLDGALLNGGRGFFVNGCVVLPGLGDEVPEGFLGLVHGHGGGWGVGLRCGGDGEGPVVV